ncbi:MAG: sporulation protein [Clostridia bacterium]|nr:sporulation protein [Clostridia bacterium]
MKTNESAGREWLPSALTLCLGGGLLLCGRQVSAAVAQSLDLCTGVLLPSLFPFFVVSSLLCGGPARRAPWLGRLTERLFGLPGSLAPAFFLGAVGGYPVGARTVCQLYETGACGKEQAVAALRFCCNAGPAFLVSALGGGLLGDGTAGLRLWAAHLLSAVLIGLFYCSKSATVKDNNITVFSCRKPGGTERFLQAVTGAAATFLNVCAFVLFFAVVTCLLEQLPVLNALPPLPRGLLYGVLELTGGAAKLAGAGLPRAVLLPTLSFLCGWGGLSVQCQTVDLLRRSGLPCRGYLRAKLLHGAVAALLTLLISR